MEASDSTALQVVKKVIDYGLDGVGPLLSASDMHREYASDGSYPDNHSRVDALIRWESSKTSQPVSSPA